MSSNLMKKNISIEGNLLKKFEKFGKKNGFTSFSALVRYAVDELIKKQEGNSCKIESEIINHVDIGNDTTHKKVDILNQRLELIWMHINSSGINGEVGVALEKIGKLLLKREADYSQILSRIKEVDDKSINTALSLLLDANVIKTK